MATPSPPPTQSISHRAWLMGLGAIVLIALVLRMLGAGGELWLDEVWSLNFALTAQNTWQIIADRKFAHDNNHILNTMLLHWIGPDRSEIVYRMPAIIAGAASVALIGIFARRFGTGISLMAAALAAWSYMLIHYGSEARGYSLLVCFTMLAAVMMGEQIRRPNLLWVIGFNISCVLGVLSHLLFVQALLGLGAWWVMERLPQRSWKFLGEGASLFAIPAATLVSLYLQFARHIEVGGATRYDWATAVLDAGALLIGVPRGGALAIAAAVLVAFMLAGGIALLARRSDRIWALVVTVTLIAPVLLLLITSHHIVLARYFIIPMTFALILLAVTLAWLAQRGFWLRLVAASALAVLLIGNARYSQRLFVHGRGHYLSALRQVVETSSENPVVLAVDQAFRHARMIEHYARFIQSGRRLEILAMSQPESMEAHWIMRHDFADDPSPSPATRSAIGVEYELVTTYRASALGGWNLHLYRRREQ